MLFLKLNCHCPLFTQPFVFRRVFARGMEKEIFKKMFVYTDDRDLQIVCNGVIAVMKRNAIRGKVRNFVMLRYPNTDPANFFYCQQAAGRREGCEAAAS